jgi:hypothetical protein
VVSIDPRARVTLSAHPIPIPDELRFRLFEEKIYTHVVSNASDLIICRLDSIKEDRETWSFLRHPFVKASLAEDQLFPATA